MLNYRHLYYFWVVAKEGAFGRAADRLDVAVQTISAQVRELEKSLGHQLLKPEHRGVTTTPAGDVAFLRADEIFRIGQSIPDEVRQAASTRVLRLAVGLSDGISKLAAHRLLQPILGEPSLRLVCHDGQVDALVADLGLHRLDMVLAGQPAPYIPALRMTSTPLLRSPIAWYAPPEMVDAVPRMEFPQSLAELPMLLPTRHSALRQTLDCWLENQGIRPRVVGEFEDSALLVIFAARGLGVFPLSDAAAQDSRFAKGMRLLGRSEAVREEVHAILSPRGQHHPLVARILSAAQDAGLEQPSVV
jgi:LysR family transcriptional activator of nhaA